MTGIVISFDEVRRRNESNTDAEAEKRIAEKEAIYRGLIEQEAVMAGVPFETMVGVIEHARKDVLASNKSSGWHEEAAKRKGISLYEHELGERIAFLELLQKAYRASPDLEFVWENLSCDW